MTIIEFTQTDGNKRYFIGDSEASILADTKNGTAFGFMNFKGHREIALDDARELKLGYFEQGIADVEAGCKSFMLSAPR